MIEKKTSVLLAAALVMGAIVGGSGERNQQLLYQFGRKLGLAFQVQDEYLDAFGDPQKFGKQIGGVVDEAKGVDAEAAVGVPDAINVMS